MTDPKTYKAEEDAERAFYLISFCNVAKDYLATQALAASFMKELTAMNLRQAERDTKEREAAMREAQHMASMAEDEEKKKSEADFPTRAPSVPRR